MPLLSLESIKNCELESWLMMKIAMMNILILIAGITMVALVIMLEIDGTLGWLMATVGVFLGFLSVVFRSKNPFKSILEFLGNIF